MADSAEPAEAPPADPTVPAADADNAPAADPTTPAAEAPASGQTQDESSDPVGDLFREVDVDGSGELDIGEVRTLCKRLGQKLDNAGIARAFREMDADASGGVDLQVRSSSAATITYPSHADPSPPPRSNHTMFCLRRSFAHGGKAASSVRMDPSTSSWCSWSAPS